MKKLLWICVALLIVAALLVGLLSFAQSRGIGISEGRCIVTSGNDVLLIRDASPIRLRGNLPENLHTGDLIRVCHGFVEETYPGGTHCYFLQKRADGDLSDLDPLVLQELSQLGWTPVTGDGSTYEILSGTVEHFDGQVLRMEVMGTLRSFHVAEASLLRTWKGLEKGDAIFLTCTGAPGEEARKIRTLSEFSPVTYTKDFASFSFRLLAGWRYEILEAQEGDEGLGLAIWPEGHAEGRLLLKYYDMFGICGTGLSQETVYLAGHRAVKGTYDGSVLWDHMIFQGLAGDYVVLNQGADSWWQEYGTEAMVILNTLEIAQGQKSRQEILTAADSRFTGAFDWRRADFDHVTGIWTVSYFRDNQLCGKVELGIDTQTVTIVD